MFLSSFKAILAAGRIHNSYILTKRPVPIQSFFLQTTYSKCILSNCFFFSRDILREKKVTTVGERSENRSKMRKYIHMKQFPWKWNEYMVFIFLGALQETKHIQYTIFYLCLFFVCVSLSMLLVVNETTGFDGKYVTRWNKNKKKYRLIVIIQWFLNTKKDRTLRHRHRNYKHESKKY